MPYPRKDLRKNPEKNPEKNPWKNPKNSTGTKTNASRIGPWWASVWCLLLLLGTAELQAGADREQQQTRLDAACETAREKKLAPLRKQFVEQCVRDKELPSRAACESYYSDYGARSGDRAPLFYDLPECKQAFEYQNSDRNPD